MPLRGELAMARRSRRLACMRDHVASAAVAGAPVPRRPAGLHRRPTLLPRAHEAALQGLLDAAEALEEGDRRKPVRRGLRCSVGSVGRAALRRLCELEGPDAALRRARADANRAVRAWRTATPATPATPATTGRGAASGRAAPATGQRGVGRRPLAPPRRRPVRAGVPSRRGR